MNGKGQWQLADAADRGRAKRSLLAGSGLVLAILSVPAQAQVATPQIPTREEIQRPAPPPT
ncbi:hypothetical protein, partial [Sphingopyxis sp. HXXIV]|uniref:hypothetical protein n=1 Tax=Sphingopyxis sp. HXXIV TaxID=1759075 RepID=UPI000AFC5E0E